MCKIFRVATSRQNIWCRDPGQRYCLATKGGTWLVGVFSGFFRFEQCYRLVGDDLIVELFRFSIC